MCVCVCVWGGGGGGVTIYLREDIPAKALVASPLSNGIEFLFRSLIKIWLHLFWRKLAIP